MPTRRRRALRVVYKGNAPQKASKTASYNLCGSLLFGNSMPGCRGGGLQADQMKFAPIQEFPLHRIAGFQTDGCCQGQGKTDI